jgi:hypothetical protein
MGEKASDRPLRDQVVTAGRLPKLYRTRGRRFCIRLVAAVVFVLSGWTCFGALPELFVQDYDAAVPPRAASIRITTRGHLVRTSCELTYRNPLDRETFARLAIELPPDAEISDLGQWVNGKLRHAVAVEREVPRNEYDEWPGADPVVEPWDGRKVDLIYFSIAAGAERTFLVAFDQELTNDDYVLDVSVRESMAAFDLEIDADGADVVENGGTIRIARAPTPTAFTARAPEDGWWYAATAIDVALAGGTVAPAPHTVVLYDTSFSSEKQDFARLRRFLQEFLSRQRPGATAEVIPFANAVERSRFIRDAGSASGRRALDRILDDMAPFGGTNLHAAVSHLESIAEASPPGTRIVLVTDGLTSLGDSHAVAAAVSKLGSVHRPLLVLSAVEARNTELLTNAARFTGGWCIDLLHTDTGAAVDASMRRPTTLRIDGGDAAPTVLAPVRPGRFAVASRSREALQVFCGVPVRTLHDDVESSMVRRAWARARLREMLATGAPDDEVLAHGRSFMQVTPRTVLAVLESWMAYESFNVPMPPELLVEKDADLRHAAEAEVLVKRLRALSLPPRPVTPGGWTIQGRVFDSEGASLPGTSVVLFDGETPLDAAWTDHEGRFALSASVAPAAPSVTAYLEGLDPARIVVSDRRELDFVLRFSPFSRGCEVSGDFVVHQTTASAEPLCPKIESAGVLDPEERSAAEKRRRDLARSIVQRMRALPSDAKRLEVYFDGRRQLCGDKGFHILAAQLFRERSPELARRVLGDLVETRDLHAPLLRVLARVLDGWGETSLARSLLERAIEVAPTERQSWRELLLLEARHGRASSVASLARRYEATERSQSEPDTIGELIRDAVARWDAASADERRRGIDVRFDASDALSVELITDTTYPDRDIRVTDPSGIPLAWNSPLHPKFVGLPLRHGPEIVTLPSAPPGSYRVGIADATGRGRWPPSEAVIHVIVSRRGERTEHLLVLGQSEEDIEVTTLEMR